jgi:hypothetical protein
MRNSAALERLLRNESGRNGSHVMVELGSIWKSVCLVGKMQAQRTEILALLDSVGGGCAVSAPSRLKMRASFSSPTHALQLRIDYLAVSFAVLSILDFILTSWCCKTAIPLHPTRPPMRPPATPLTSPSEPPGCTSGYSSIVANLRHHRHHDVVRSHPFQGVAVLVATRPETLIDFHPASLPRRPAQPPSGRSMPPNSPCERAVEENGPSSPCGVVREGFVQQPCSCITQAPFHISDSRHPLSTASSASLHLSSTPSYH